MRTRALPGIILLAAILMLFSQYMIWIWSPVELTLGIVQKIFYIHVSLAWWGFFSFFLVFVASIWYLLVKENSLHYLAGAAAEVGVLFSALVLLTGIAWAKASWNVWWTWDPRLVTTLVMWFIYSAYLMLRGLDSTQESLRPAIAVLGIVAFINVPLVFLSARMWRSIHPSVITGQEGGMPFSMILTLSFSLLAWGVICGLLVGLRYRQLLAQSRISDLVLRRQG